jgi:hypothetical protein
MRCWILKLEAREEEHRKENELKTKAWNEESPVELLQLEFMELQL